MSYSDQKMYNIFKSIRNLIRKYNAEDIVMFTIDQLVQQDHLLLESSRGNEKYINDMARKQPWHMLLLIKWAVKYGEFSQFEKKEFNYSSFAKLMNHFNEMSGKIRLPSEYAHHNIFFRNLAYQQFWVQEGFDKTNFYRQLYFFSNSPKNSVYSQLFFDKTGLVLSESIEYLMVLLVFLLNSAKWRFSISPQSYFREMFKIFSEKHFMHFMDSISNETHEMKQFITDKEGKEVRVSHEYFERSILQKAPFIRLADRSYKPISKILAINCLENYIYETLRSSDPERFMQKFGIDFENYIGEIIALSRCAFLNENELKKINLDSKLVDFILYDEESILYVDAKGVEMSSFGMISHSPEIITSQVKNSLIKGIDQAITVHIELNKKNIPNLSSKKNNYIFIITYKDFFLGRGDGFLHCIDISRLDKYLSCPLDFELGNIYFISIYDFELFISYSIKHGESIFNLLQNISNEDDTPYTKKFIFRQHLQDLDASIEAPSFVKKPFDKLTEEIISRVRNVNE